jgi:hypothetical protein
MQVLKKPKHGSERLPMDETAVVKASKMKVPITKQLSSWYEICQQVTDGRKARGRRYDLAGSLRVLVWAKLAGMSSVLAVSEWAKDQETPIRASVGLGWKRLACATTSSSVLARLDRHQVKAHLAAWFVCQMAAASTDQPDERHVHLASAGKTLKSPGEQARARRASAAPSALLAPKQKPEWSSHRSRSEARPLKSGRANRS